MNKFDRPKYGKFTGSTVEVTNDNFEKAVRKFKKKVLESGLFQDLRNRECYVKPTTARKQAMNSAKRRWQKKLESSQMPKKMY